jgi:hypothetical protein
MDEGVASVVCVPDLHVSHNTTNLAQQDDADILRPV